MKKDGVLQSYLSRRQLLKWAVNTAAFVSASSLIGTGYTQSRPEAVAPRIRESFDWGWRFSRGDFPGAHMTEFSDSGWRALDLPHDWSIEGEDRQIDWRSRAPFGSDGPSVMNYALTVRLVGPTFSSASE